MVALPRRPFGHRGCLDLQAYTRVGAPVCAYVYTHLYAYVYAHADTHVYAHVYARVYAHVYTHVYTQGAAITSATSAVPSSMAPAPARAFCFQNISEHADGECRRSGADPIRGLNDGVFGDNFFPMPPLGSVVAPRP